MKNPIAPYDQTPAGIRAYQENEPYPNWQAIYEQHLPDEDAIIDAFLELSQAKYHSFGGSFDNYRQHLDGEARAKADQATRIGTDLPWKKLKELVWIRDRGICDVCERELAEDEYDCGHIVDKTCGGSNRLDNLVVMCGKCNRKRKGLHQTKEAYFKWRDQRLWEQKEKEMFREIMARHKLPEEFEGYAETLFAVLQALGRNRLHSIFVIPSSLHPDSLQFHPSSEPR